MSRKGRGARFTMTIEPEVLAALDRIADQEERSRAYVVRRILRSNLGLDGPRVEEQQQQQQPGEVQGWNPFS